MSCYLLFVVCCSFIHSSQDVNRLRSSGTILNYDNNLQVRYNLEQQKLYCGPQNFPVSVPVYPGLQDGILIGGKENLLLLRFLNEGRATFILQAEGEEKNSFSSSDNSQLLRNQKRIIGGWGTDTNFGKILVAWLEFFITAKSVNQVINNMLPMAVLEMVEALPDDFHAVVDLKIFDIYPDPLQDKALSAQAPMSFAIEEFPLSSRVKLFPSKILFSPDSKYCIIQTDCGFVLQSLIQTYPLKEAEVFSFPDDSDLSGKNKKVLREFVIKWITNDCFWVLCYTDLVTKFLRYSKEGSAWWSDSQPDDFVNAINGTIGLFNKQYLELLRLRFGSLQGENTEVDLFGIFKGSGQERSIAKIPL